MPKPNEGENKENYIKRFMGSAEARRDYPKEDQRFAVAESLWEHRNALEMANALGYNAERDGAEPFSGRHLQPGVANYPELKHPVTGKQGIAVLIEKDVIDQMRPTAKGAPIVNWAHDFTGGAEKWIANGKAVGVMVASNWNGEDGYEHCETMIWDKEAKANARNGFRWSNAWKEDEIDWTPGMHNGVAYDGRVKAAHYTHLAIVPNPRYEGAVIFANSIGDMIMKIFGIGKAEGVELAKEAKVKIGEKQYTPLEVANALASMEAFKSKITAPEASEIKPEHQIEVGGKKYSGLEVANALAAIEKTKAAAAAEAIKKGDSPKFEETPEFANAVAKCVTEALEKAKGEGFFNAVERIAQLRPGIEAKAPVRMTEKQRVENGRKRFGKKEPVKA